MPRRPQARCTNPECRQLHDGTGKCPACAEEQRAAAQQRTDKQRPSAARRGYDRRWRETRREFLAVYRWCAVCGAPAVDADHVDGLGPLGPRGHDWSNLRPLCKTHHSQRTARDQPGGWNARR